MTAHNADYVAEAEVLVAALDRVAEKVRHDVSRGVCWCGSTHSWELAKDGSCRCRKPRCVRTHFDGPEEA